MVRLGAISRAPDVDSGVITLVAPEPATLVQCVVSTGTNRSAPRVHGQQHWQCVAEAGLKLVNCTPDADATVVFLFAVLHDAMREDDDWDQGHGERAAGLARQLNGMSFMLDDARLDLLCAACAGHELGETTTDPTVGVCWDADRLNLWRCDIIPEAQYLSTPAGRSGEVIRWAERLSSRRFSWSDLHRRYAAAQRAATPGA